MSKKQQIWDYIKEHPESSIQTVSKALNIEEIEVLKHINEMQKNRYIRLAGSVPLNGYSSCSSYYSIGDREYHDE